MSLECDFAGQPRIALAKELCCIGAFLRHRGLSCSGAIRITWRRRCARISILMRKLVLRLPQEQWRRNRLAIHVAVALFYGGFTAVIPFLPYYLKQLGVTGEARIASWSGILITIGPLLAALLGPAWGRLGDRYGMKLMFERCTLAQSIHWVLFAFALSPYHLLGLRVLIGLLGGLTTFSVPLLVSTTPKEHMSRSIGALQTVQMLSSALGPLFGGLLADSIGI
jgi:MFS transporter, DHA1 family, multidrug resistance protein